MPQVAVLIGSLSDKEKMQPCLDVLQDLQISYTFNITSAHRTPERTESILRSLEREGCEVFICAAGLAAHLAGAVAARTLKPVLGVPLNASSLGGMDSLLSTVQMPPGYPVATLALDKVGAKNAAWLAAQILALQDHELAERIQKARIKMKESVEQSSGSLQQ